MLYSSYNSVMLFDNYSGITLRNTNLRTSNIQAPMPRLIIGYQEIPQLFTQVVVNNSCSELWEVHGFVTNVLILEPNVYCAVGCLESVEWNGGMDYWNGILEWTRTTSFYLHIIYSVV